MAHMKYLILLALLSLSGARVEISRPSNVLEDTWAEVSCTIKKHNAVKWRIGSFTDEGHIYNLGYRLGEMEGLEAEYVSTTVSGSKKTEVIRILATMDLNGIPIECMSESTHGKKYEYSPFVRLEVMPSTTTEGSGGMEMISRVEISHSSNILKDTWAEFSCTIKKHDTVKWRIGSFTDEGHIYNHGSRLGEIEGLEAEYVDTTISGNKKTEVIRILATMDLNGVPIECMSESTRGKKYEYSQFVLLEVMPSTTTEGSGGMEMMSTLRERHSVPETEYTEEAISGEKQTVATSLLAVFSTIAATMARI